MALRGGRVFYLGMAKRITWKTSLNYLETFSVFVKAGLGELWPIHAHSCLISLPGSGYAKSVVH